MGFFENLGRKVEEFKRTAEETAAEEATHACRSCGERFFHDHDECPQCGADAVVARERDRRGASESGGDSPRESVASEPTETADHATDTADTATDADDTATDADDTRTDADDTRTDDPDG